ncbi:MAG TPA: lysylphosphatidylglycerol synthase transmembrane domain-containing protein [Anaerolineae bacterium]|nr:lysylphosphatidylglycerol synthase transmembrane domain-containing protein [Anaerolineae bacterium]HQK12620.1 lysylphosphatidylglycerol synthase transmembrane domain-containing protein [Anaerolineae bacterium]
MKKARQRWLNLARIALSLGTLALLLHQVGGDEVARVLRCADLRWLGLAALLFLVGIVIRVFRWRALLHGLGVRPPFWLLCKLYLVGNFFNTILPSGFGGDVVRVLELAQQDRQAAAVGTVVVDRLTGILSLMALGLLVLPFTRGLAPWLVWMFIAIAVGGLAGGALLLEGKLLRRVTARLPRALSLAGEGKLAAIYAAVTGSGARAVWLALLLSTLFNLVNIAVYWLCGLAVGMTVKLGFYFVFVPLLSLTLLIPISVGGLGARDWVAQPLFGSVGVPDAVAAGMTLSVYAVTLAVGLIGFAIYLIEGIAGLLRK